jgi:hypothetical protein
MPWKMILDLVGTGLHYNKPRQVFLDAIDEADRRGRQDVVEHLRIMLSLRDTVMFDQPKKDPE